MTATVIEDAELGFLPPERLDALFRHYPGASLELLRMLVEKTIEIQNVRKALLFKERQPSQHSPIA